MSHSAFCGLSRGHLGELVTELAPRWEARCESARRQRRRGDRRRQAGAGPKYELVFTTGCWSPWSACEPVWPTRPSAWSIRSGPPRSAGRSWRPVRGQPAVPRRPRAPVSRRAGGLRPV